jgi:hypothetical protein
MFVIHKEALVAGDQLRVPDSQFFHALAEIAEREKSFIMDIEIAESVLAEVFHHDPPVQSFINGANASRFFLSAAGG